MTPGLRLLVCRHFLRETEAIIAEAGWPEVTCSTYPELCLHPQSTEAARRELADDDRREGEERVLVGACFMLRDQKVLAAMRADRVYERMNCFHMFTAAGLVDRQVAAGSYLLTPGWIEHWPEHLEEWGFDRDTARAFFGESASGLLLLDTGVLADAEQRLVELAEHLALPWEVMPVGLDHFRLELTKIVLEWRAERAQQDATTTREQAHRKLADHAMAFDLLLNLTRTMGREEAVQGVLELFTMLFAAQTVIYAEVEDGQPGAISSTGAGPVDGAQVRRYLELLGDTSAFAETDGGFCVRVTYHGETIGVLGVEQMAFPQYRREYLNLTMAIVSLCGMAMTNAANETRRRQAEAALVAKSAELERSNEDLTQFAHVASHDLQAPLRTVTSFLQLLQRRYSDDLDPDAQEFIGYAVDGAEQMKLLISGLLEYARVGTQVNPLRKVDLQHSLDIALKQLSASVAEAGARVTADPLPRVHGDRTLLVQLLQNLVGNAVKYRGEAPPEIHVAAQQVDEGWQISVRDNGIGLKMKYAEEVFAVFRRLHAQDEIEGTGIGLATCKRIVARHGGRIWVESVPGQGATFTFTLLATTGEDGS